MKRKNSKQEELSGFDELMTIVDEIKLFHTQEEDFYARFKIGDHNENWSLRSNQFRSFVFDWFIQKYQKPPGAQDFRDVMNMLEHKAKNGKKRDVYTRIARVGRSIYVDLCDKKWRVIKITPRGWKVLLRSPVYFIRNKGMKPLPKPKKYKERILTGFGKFIHSSGRNTILIIMWILKALSGEKPYPILTLLGDPNSGKSTVARMIKELIDPAKAPLRDPSKNAHDLAIMARNNNVVVFDNVSKISPWLSDALCRLATGGGFSKREYYTDFGEVIFDDTRPVILNGIYNMITRRDLAQRAIIIRLMEIDEEEQKPDEVFWKEFNQKKPFFLGALLDGLSAALRNEDKVKVQKYPRMADFVRWGVAAESKLFNHEGKFIEAYNKNLKSMAKTIIGNDLVGRALMEFIKGEKGNWSGKVSDLLNLLEQTIPALDRTRITHKELWPKGANILSARIKELKTFFHKNGIEIDFGRSGESRRISIQRTLKK